MEKRAVFFDFDGLTIDTETPEFEAWQEIYAEHGAELSIEVWSVSIGTLEHGFDPVDHLENLIGRNVNRSQIWMGHRERFHAGAFTSPPTPGLLDRLAEARELGCTIGIVSSSPIDWVGPHLEERGLLHWFDFIQTSDEVALTKPDPELYLKALKKAGVAGSGAIAFEDSRNGVLAAKAAGIHAVAVPNSVTQSLCFDEADQVVESLEDVSIRQLFDQIERSHKEE